MTKWFNLLWKTVFRICGLILVLLLLLYVFLYIVVPHYYYATAQSDVNHKFEQLYMQIEGGTLESAKEQIDLFESDGNLDVGLVDQEGYVVYAVTNFSEKDRLEENSHWKLIKGETLREEELQDTQYEGVRDLPKVVRRIQTVELDGTQYRMVFSWYTKSIRRVERMMSEIFPITCVIMILGALIGGLFYAKWSTAPLIAVAEKAERFSGKPDRRKRKKYASDEIGTLQYGLDMLHEQLQEKVQELEQKNQNLEESMQRILELEKVQGDFFAAASHELKTPIAASQVMLEGMIQQVGVYQDREKYLRECRRQMGKLSHLVEELLELSRLREEKPQEAEEVDIRCFLERLKQDYAYLAEKFAVSIQMSIQNELVVYLSASLLYKALSNGLSNAIRHGEPGGDIIIRLEDTILDISNEGDIDESMVAEGAEVFQRQQDGRAGCGFGLYFIETIMNLLELPYRIYNGEDGRVHFRVDFSAKTLTKTPGKATIKENI